MAVIIVIDTDAPAREQMSGILEEAGYVVVQAENGSQAQNILRETPADLVVLEIVMREGDGWSVLEDVRKMSPVPPVVVATSSHELLPPGHLGRYVSGYLIKPFGDGALLKTCRTVLITPPIVPADGSRKEPRRTYLAKAMLLSPDTDQPVASGQLVQLSQHGFRVDLALPFRSGDVVRIGFLVPGHPNPVRLTGRVRWRNDVTLGAEIEDVDPADQERLRSILDE